MYTHKLRYLKVNISQITKSAVILNSQSLLNIIDNFKITVDSEICIRSLLQFIQAASAEDTFEETKDQRQVKIHFSFVGIDISALLSSNQSIAEQLKNILQTTNHLSIQESKFKSVFFKDDRKAIATVLINVPKLSFKSSIVDLKLVKGELSKVISLKLEDCTTKFPSKP